MEQFKPQQNEFQLQSWAIIRSGLNIFAAESGRGRGRGGRGRGHHRSKKNAAED
jgi:hypothetical protein